MPAGSKVRLRLRSIVINAGGNSILVLEGASGQLNNHQVFVSPSSVDAPTAVAAPRPASHRCPCFIRMLLDAPGLPRLRTGVPATARAVYLTRRTTRRCPFAACPLGRLS